MRSFSTFVVILTALVALSPSPVAAVDLQPAMGKPVAGLTAAQLDRFNQGKLAFETLLTVPNGLGPVFNQQSCASCHNNPVGGSGSIAVTRFGYFDEKGGGFDPMADYGGSLLQEQAINTGCAEVVPPGANVTTLRITNSALGFGLVEAIDDADILANESSGPGVSGKAHIVPVLEYPAGPFPFPIGPTRVGRFGWKAQVGTVLSFSGDASLNEMGLTNRLVGTENDPNGIYPPSLGDPDFCDTVPDPEDGPDMEGFHFIDRVTDFQRFLAPPPQTPRSGMAGEAIFNAIGCNACHIQSFTTRADLTLEAPLRNKTIKPYSDFLLHDMGILGDGIEQGMASVREIRTPPLWGVRVRDPMLHDGRVGAGTFASRINAVIGWHNVLGSEAAPSGAAYQALSAEDKNKVIAFLDSLGRREFDYDGDNDVDGGDLQTFADCYGGGPYTPDDACAIGDVDQDGDVDRDDYNLFLTVYNGPQGDCNSNSVNDATDILNGISRDCNTNGTPDECDPETTDINLFVALLLGNDTNPVHICMLDQNNDSTINGLDMQPFVNNLLP